MTQFQKRDTVSKKVLYFFKKNLNLLMQTLHIRLYEKKEKNHAFVKTQISNVTQLSAR